jgi:uncharacterized protein DUF6265
MRSLIVLALLMAAPASAPPADPAAQLASLSWMVGSWGSTENGTWAEEHWVAARGGTMLGLHRDVKGAKATGFEFLRIEAGPDRLVYLASPGGAPATPFRAVEVSAGRAVFENEAHDFPQRILYWKSAGALHTRIEGPRGGQERAMEWRWPAIAAYGRDK